MIPTLATEEEPGSLHSTMTADEGGNDSTCQTGLESEQQQLSPQSAESTEQALKSKSTENNLLESKPKKKDRQSISSDGSDPETGVDATNNMKEKKTSTSSSGRKTKKKNRQSLSSNSSDHSSASRRASASLSPGTLRRRKKATETGSDLEAEENSTRSRKSTGSKSRSRSGKPRSERKEHGADPTDEDTKVSRRATSLSPVATLGRKKALLRSCKSERSLKGIPGSPTKSPRSSKRKEKQERSLSAQSEHVSTSSKVLSPTASFAKKKKKPKKSSKPDALISMSEHGTLGSTSPSPRRLRKSKSLAVDEDDHANDQLQQLTSERTTSLSPAPLRRKKSKKKQASVSSGSDQSPKSSPKRASSLSPRPKRRSKKESQDLKDMSPLPTVPPSPEQNEEVDSSVVETEITDLPFALSSMELHPPCEEDEMAEEEESAHQESENMSTSPNQLLIDEGLGNDPIMATVGMEGNRRASDTNEKEERKTRQSVASIVSLSPSVDTDEELSTREELQPIAEVDAAKGLGADTARASLYIDTAATLDDGAVTTETLASEPSVQVTENVAAVIPKELAETLSAISTPSPAAKVPTASISPKSSSSKKPVDLTPLVSNEVRASVALDAAGIGQYTRLKEHVVESLSEERIQEDQFFVKSGVHAQTPRSRLFQCINEAAAMGNIRQKQKPHEVLTNYEPENGSMEDVDGDHVLQADGSRVVLETTEDPGELVDVFVINQSRLKMKKLLDAEYAVEAIEAQSALSAKFKENEVELPSATVPKFKKPVCYMTGGRLRNAVVLSAAEEAHERIMRLSQKKQLKVRAKCRCIYCKNPTTFQTQSYQKLRMKQGWSDDSLEAEVETEDVHLHSSSPLPRGTARRNRHRNTIAALTSPKAAKNAPRDSSQESKKTNNDSVKNMKAWKARAAKARKELYEKGSRSISPVPSPVNLERSQSDAPPARHNSLQSPGILGGGTPGGASWDPRLLSPPPKESTPPKPAWTTGVKLRKAKVKDSETRMKELDSSKHQPAWAAGKDFLLDHGGIHVSPGKDRKGIDKLAMTEHSPMRQGMQLRNRKQHGLKYSPVSFDGEIDEEALLRESLLAPMDLGRATSEGATKTAHSVDETTESDSDFEDDEDDFAF